jgi:NADH dehydrogenase [ubiquinone] 1 alpha subcomplex assembly factor 6
MTALSYTAETVRKHDPDRFLLSLFAPPDKRAALFALYAFNYEIAKTREVVTETQLGLIRLQWWRDALAGVYERDAVPEHQTLQPLAAAIKTYGLPREAFDNLIYAREFDLEDRAPAGLDGMMKYAEYTAAPLLGLSLDILGEAGDAAKIATAYALAGLLRTVPVHLSQRRCYLPEDLLRGHQLSIYDLYDGTGIGRLPPVVEHVTAAARQCLQAAGRPASPFLRRQAKLASLYLDKIRACGYDVFSSHMAVPPVLREARLWWAGLF